MKWTEESESEIEWAAAEAWETESEDGDVAPRDPPPVAELFPSR